MLALIVVEIGFTHAATFEGKYQHGDLSWQSAVNVKDGVTAALWDLPMRQPVGDRMIPGGFAGVSADNTIGLVNESGDQLVFPFSIEGIQYRVSDASSIVDAIGYANTSVSGDIATVLGSGSGNKVIHFDGEQSMLKSYRPIISINQAYLNTLLDGDEQGVYTGVTSLDFQYDIYRNNIRSRQTVTLPFRVSVTFNRSSIYDAVITSGQEGVLTPKYHGHPDLVVSALGHYGVRITGDFSLGLKADVDTIKGTSFVLNNPVDATSEIAYSVICASGCLGGNKDLITDGQLSGASVQIDNSNVTEANIILNVGFDNKLYSELVPGTYQGHFRLIFEAEI